MRRFLKRTAESLLASPPTLQFVSRLRPASGVVLAYHNVVEPGSPACGDSSLHVRLDDFVDQIAWLVECYEVGGLSDLLNRDPAGDPVVVFTFDDAYAGALRLAIPELISRGLPATIFACSGWSGGEIPWWDAFADDAGLPAEFRFAALTEYRGKEERVDEWAVSLGRTRRELPSDYRIGTVADLRAAARQAGITIGAHTRSHPNLRLLPDEELRSELAHSFAFLSTGFASFVPWLAYPYGLSDSRVKDAAEAIGFVGAVQVKGGPIRRGPPPDQFAIPRVYVPRGISLDNFKLRVAGIW